LQPAGSGGYFQTIDARLVHPIAQPTLALLDESGRAQQTFRHQRDFGFVTEGHGGSGQADAPLVFVGFQPGRSDFPWESFKGLDLRGKTVLLLSGNAPADFPTEALIRGAEGALWISGERTEMIRSQIQLPDPDADYLRRPTIPIFKIRLSAADALLAPAGLDVAALRDDLNAHVFDGDRGFFTQDLETRVQMSLTLAEPEEVELFNILGYLPGQDIALDDQLVIVAAHYDGLGRDPDDTVYPAANNNASGSAILLEMIRLWQERGLTPRRSVLFAAWAGGELDYSGAETYFNGGQGRLGILNTVAVFQLDNLGAGGDALRIDATSSRLADLVESSAGQVGLSVVQEKGSYHTYQDVVRRQAPSVLISWQDSHAIPEHDTLDRIDPAKLSSAGEAIILALTSAARLPNY